jgi:hypothetical protein
MCLNRWEKSNKIYIEKWIQNLSSIPDQGRCCETNNLILTSLMVQIPSTIPKLNS